MKKIMLTMFFLTATCSVFASNASMNHNDSQEMKLERVENPFLKECKDGHQNERNSPLAKNGIIINEEINQNNKTTEV